MNLFLVLFISAVNLYPTTVDTTSIQSEISEIVVYRQQAQIQRTAAIQLKSGKNTLVFKGLSPFLLSGSLQFRGDKPFTILSMNTRLNFFEEQASSPTIRRLEAERDSLNKHLIILNSELSVLNRQIRFLENTENMINNQEISPAEQADLMDFYQNKMLELERKKIELNEEIAIKNDQLKKILAQLDESGYGQPKRLAEVIAEIYAEKTETLNVEIQYLVQNAGWNPSYDIKGSDITAPLQINYKANIYQNTGINWNEKTLSISSSNPTLNSILPVITPVFAEFIPDRVALSDGRSLEETVLSGYSAKAKMGEGEMEAPMELPVPPTQTIQNQTSFTYKFQIPYSIPSDGKKHILEFRREDVYANFTYSAVPKYSEQAYLTAKITEWDSLNLIPGEAAIYFENNYIGSTRINSLSFDDSLQVSLGSDEGIVVERQKLREFEERNFFGNKIRDNHSNEIRIRNTKTKPVRIIIKDQIPVSKNEAISIKAITSSGGTLDRETGIITWIKDVPPGQTENIRLEFVIEYPKDKKISY